MREFIVEADGGSRGNPGPAGYGAVVCDAATGQTLLEAAEYIGVATNNVAEYRGLLAGLRAAHTLDPAATVHVRMDSKLVIEQMSGRWKIKHPSMKPLATQARGIFPPDRVTYEWIPRAENKHADRLANEAMDAGARGEQWSPGDSVADMDVAAGGSAAASTPAVVAAGHQDAPGTTTRGWTSAPDLGAPATLVLLRHGETPLTPQKRFSGSGGTDPALSAAGRDQAHRVADALARRGTVQTVLASPLTRTRETAEIVAARLGLDVVVEDGLRETDFGAWEGLTFGEVRDRYPDDLNAWLADPAARPTGGGESFAEVAARIAVTKDELVTAHAGRTVLLVTHVTPIKTLVRLALGAPPESLFRMELSAASLSAVAYYADGNASVRLFNDTSHLR
ncbi:MULTISPECIES: bifunctional RNase H/acid phosphatase [Streptomyces]|uniref:bifunctional RNase H/acid phosphatase n=1 Tax=Streptomyces TaxID=1883 RepID=UPI00081E957B|nr:MULTISPECIES: bifunctional RNase H/acid phosphatase [unclassified Streptomyces]MYQ91373.1 bifunctional RNase H/acid phosphatase [Streptomyces sp. SID4946]SCF67060.1 probable phosphoglycerate mutase [Streptomyces sp. DconLS]SCF77321.1 probable phosphoglycerate mutase [Streptomyces sp. LamerLS-31b]